MTKLETLCYGVQIAEGWDRDSRSWRNNNPGNLRSSYLASGVREDFAFFATYELGWRALYTDLWLKCSGRSKTTIRPETPLHEFVRIFACPENQKAHDNYLALLVRWTGAQVDTPMSWFLLS